MRLRLRLRWREVNYVCIKLTDEAREIVVFEVLGEQISSEIGGLPDDESRASLIPGNDVVGGGIVDELVGLGEKRRRKRPLRHWWKEGKNEKSIGKNELRGGGIVR